MVKKGDTIEDVIKYVEFRIHHLRLEREKVPYYISKDKIQKALDKLSAKISELQRVKKVLHEDIKGHSKYEWNKWQYLKEKKVIINREKEDHQKGDENG